MLLDTSGLLCCFDADEGRHHDAVGHYQAAPRRLTRNYILAEFVALAQARRLAREASLGFIATITGDAEVEVVWADPALHDEALVMLRAQLGKSYSLCDAVSFVLMRRHGVTDAMTTDRHFDRAGFRRLLPP